MCRCLAVLTVLLAAVFLLACGTAHTKTVIRTVPEKVTTAPPSVAPETSITPSGPGNPSPAKPNPPPSVRSLSAVAVAASVQKHIDANGLHLIEGFEGFSSCPYYDSVGTGHPQTRGYGETEGIHSYSPCISRAFGEANLKSRIERYYEPYLRAQHVALNQNQWNAAVSFAWNLGSYIWYGTTIGAQLRAHNFRGVANSMLQYVHAGGQVLAGLVTRRRAEVALFLKGAPAPAPFHRRDLEARRRTLRRYLLRYGCTRRRHHHERLGPRCTRWFHEGDLVNHRLRVGR